MVQISMLSERYSGQLKNLLVKREDFRPFPKTENRADWEGLAPELKKSILKNAEEALWKPWDVLPATGYMEYRRNGNRSRYESIYFVRRARVLALLLGECLEDKNRFVDKIIDGIWLICEETSWVIPAHNDHLGGPKALPDEKEVYIDLFSAETASLLTWAHYFLSHKLAMASPLIPRRMEDELEKRIVVPFENNDQFGWMGFYSKPPDRVNNWNPWIHSNLLPVLLLMEKDAVRRTSLIEKSIRSLDRFIDPYPRDGGCDEGPMYWTAAGAALFDCLELLFIASKGRIHVYDEEVIRNIGRFIYRVHIDGDQYVNFADSSPHLHVSGDLIKRYGERIGDADMKAHGSYVMGHPVEDLHTRHGSWKLSRLFSALFDADHAAVRMNAPLVRDVFLPDIQVMTAREARGSSRGLYLAAKGGHNAESHNHNDVGSFVVYSDGKPGFIDVGVETYSEKTFSPRRYEIWTMRSPYHNLPTVKGVEESAGADFKAGEVRYENLDSQAAFSLRIEKAFPENAGMVSWRRDFKFQRGKDPHIELTEDFALKGATDNLYFSFMSLAGPRLTASGKVVLEISGARSLELAYDSSLLAPTVEQIKIEDEKLRKEWGDVLYRLILKIKKEVLKETLSFRIRQI